MLERVPSAAKRRRLGATASPWPRQSTALLLVMTLCALARPDLAYCADRVDVTTLRPLLLAAIEHGESHGRLVGANADFMTRMFNTREPMEVDVKSVRSLPEEGCKRLEVTTTQKGAYPDARGLKVMTPAERAATKNGTVPMDVRFTYQISYCRNGRFPRQSGG